MISYWPYLHSAFRYPRKGVLRLCHMQHQLLHCQVFVRTPEWEALAWTAQTVFSWDHWRGPTHVPERLVRGSVHNRSSNRRVPVWVLRKGREVLPGLPTHPVLLCLLFVENQVFAWLHCGGYCSFLLCPAVRLNLSLSLCVWHCVKTLQWLSNRTFQWPTTLFRTLIQELQRNKDTSINWAALGAEDQSAVETNAWDCKPVRDCVFLENSLFHTDPCLTKAIRTELS